MSFFYPVPEPYQKAISQKFGENPADYARFKLKGHNGLDFAVPLNTPIYAITNGVVITVTEDVQGYGKYIKMACGDKYIIYAHLSCIMVRVGDKLTTGQVIGRSGSTGNSTGPHLHLEIRQVGLEGNGYYGAIDPLPMLTDPAPMVEPAPNAVAFAPGQYKVLPTQLNVRLSPSGDDRGDLLEGDAVEITGPPVLKNGITWVPIRLYVACQFNNEPYLKNG
jgi:murein DD-endopeptidase MepM/ murein hydrolase activator NlpD